MAGIGFALRKLTRRDDLLGLLQAYGHSALSSTGPWMFTVLALGLLEVIGARYASLGELAEFRRIIIYNFAFSLVLSGPVILIVTRYLADGIYSKSVETATGTAIGAMAFMFATQALIVVPFYLFYVNLDTTVRVAALINYFLISGIWLASVFLSALKDYKLVTRSFGLGLFIGVAGAVQLADQYSVSGLLFGFSIGLAVIVFALFARIYAEYPYDLSRPFAFLAYFRKYPSLAASGFVYSLGLWIDKLLMWTAPERSEHPSGMIDYPNYDGAMFAAYLTIIPSMALFTLIVETGFYERYLRFYRGIHGGAAHALCAPLITTSTGTKFGKTAEGAVWLDPDLTSPYKFYQFWINADDRDVESYLKILTFKSPDDIAGLLAEHHADPGARIPHRALAKDLTERIHGRDTESRVASASRVFFNRQSIETIKSAPVEVWETLESELPSWTTSRDDLPSTVVDLIAAAGLTDSKGDARRQLQQGGVYINGERADGESTVADYSLLADRYLWLRRGKKKDVIVKVTE